MEGSVAKKTIDPEANVRLSVSETPLDQTRPMSNHPIDLHLRETCFLCRF